LALANLLPKYMGAIEGHNGFHDRRRITSADRILTFKNSELTAFSTALGKLPPRGPCGEGIEISGGAGRQRAQVLLDNDQDEQDVSNCEIAELDAFYIRGRPESHV
jgi:hypothetical protein